MSPEVDCYLDRFEGDLAILLVDGEERLIASAMLPPDAREGDHLLINISSDLEAHNQTAMEISDLQKELKNENGGL